MPPTPYVSPNDPAALSASTGGAIPNDAIPISVLSLGKSPLLPLSYLTQELPSDVIEQQAVRVLGQYRIELSLLPDYPIYRRIALALAATAAFFSADDDDDDDNDNSNLRSRLRPTDFNPWPTPQDLVALETSTLFSLHLAMNDRVVFDDESDPDPAFFGLLEELAGPAEIAGIAVACGLRGEDASGPLDRVERERFSGWLLRQARWRASMRFWAFWRPPVRTLVVVPEEVWAEVLGELDGEAEEEALEAAGVKREVVKTKQGRGRK